MPFGVPIQGQELERFIQRYALYLHKKKEKMTEKTIGKEFYIHEKSVSRLARVHWDKIKMAQSKL